MRYKSYKMIRKKHEIANLIIENAKILLTNNQCFNADNRQQRE